MPLGGSLLGVFDDRFYRRDNRFTTLDQIMADAAGLTDGTLITILELQAQAGPKDGRKSGETGREQGGRTPWSHNATGPVCLHRAGQNSGALFPWPSPTRSCP
jgi:hypothetical protein